MMKQKIILFLFFTLILPLNYASAVTWIEDTDNKIFNLAQGTSRSDFLRISEHEDVNIYLLINGPDIQLTIRPYGTGTFIVDTIVDSSQPFQSGITQEGDYIIEFSGAGLGTQGITTIDVSYNFLGTGTGGGCLIATATYGSELAPQVQQLRELRDNTLLQTKSGSSFMTGFNQFYYSFSPTIADWERQNSIFKEAVKLFITPLIASLSILNYVDIDSEAKMLGYGISLILLNVGMYFVAPAILVHTIRRKVI